MPRCRIGSGSPSSSGRFNSPCYCIIQSCGGELGGVTGTTHFIVARLCEKSHGDTACDLRSKIKSGTFDTFFLTKECRPIAMAESMPSALCIGPSTFKGRYMPETSHPPPLHLLPSETYKKVLEKVFGWPGVGGTLSAQVRLVPLSLCRREWGG